MTCTCGAKMCYICKAKGVDYDHFYGQVVLFPTQGSLFFVPDRVRNDNMEAPTFSVNLLKTQPNI